MEQVQRSSAVGDRGRLPACLPACLPGQHPGLGAVRLEKDVSSPAGGRARLRDQVQELCSRQHERLVRFALAFAGPGGRAAAEDIVQTALIALLRKGDPLPDVEKKQLSRVRWFIRHAGKKHQSRRKGRRTTDLPGDSSALLGDGTDAGGVLEQITLYDDVRRALMTLTDAEREVVELRFFEGLSYQEIAERRQCAVSTCKNLWSSAKDKLKRFLSEIYGDQGG